MGRLSMKLVPVVHRPRVTLVAGILAALVAETSTHNVHVWVSVNHHSKVSSNTALPFVVQILACSKVTRSARLTNL